VSWSQDGSSADLLGRDPDISAVRGFVDQAARHGARFWCPGRPGSARPLCWRWAPPMPPQPGCGCCARPAPSFCSGTVVM